MTNDYLIKKVFRSNVAISIFAMLAATIGMLVDGIVIGQMLGQQSVTGFGMASPVFIFIAALAGIFSNGGTALCSNYLGRGDLQKVASNFTVTMLSSLITGIVITVVCVIFCDELSVFLGAKDDITPFTSSYIKGIGIGGIVIMLSQVMMMYVRIDNGMTFSFISVLGMTGANIALDLIFAGPLKLGLYGMGLATSISYAVCLLICITHLFRKNSKLKLSAAALKNSGGELKDVFFTGIPSALNRACLTVRSILLNNLLLALGGSIAVSALTVQNNVNQILSAITMGIGSTVMLMIGIFYGERDDSSMRKTLKISVRSGAVISFITALIVFIFAKPTVGMFLSNSPETVELAIRSLRFFCVSLPFAVVCNVLINYYQCTHNLVMANVICACHGLIFVAAAAFALSPVIGTDGVWVSFPIAEILSLLLVGIIATVKKKKVPTGVPDIMFIPDNFVPRPEYVMDISLKNDMTQVMELSEKITGFCEEHYKDKDKISKLALCVEEIAGNIVQHGFSDGKEHFIDIRIIAVGNNIIFRIRDDGIGFDPLSYPIEANEEKLGIKMIQKIALDIKYSNAIGLNNLTVTI